MDPCLREEERPLSKKNYRYCITADLSLTSHWPPLSHVTLPTLRQIESHPDYRQNSESSSYKGPATPDCTCKTKPRLWYCEGKARGSTLNTVRWGSQLHCSHVLPRPFLSSHGKKDRLRFRHNTDDLDQELQSIVGCSDSGFGPVNKVFFFSVVSIEKNKSQQMWSVFTIIESLRKLFDPEQLGFS